MSIGLYQSTFNIFQDFVRTRLYGNQIFILRVVTFVYVQFVLPYMASIYNLNMILFEIIRRFHRKFGSLTPNRHCRKKENHFKEDKCFWCKPEAFSVHRRNT